MPEPETPTTPEPPIRQDSPITAERKAILSRKARRERQQNARRVFLDPSSPTIRSIVRVVIVVLILLFLASSVQAILFSLSGLFFLIVLSIFFAYLIDPIVRLLRNPFKIRGLDRFMPRWAAILLAYIFVFSIIAGFIATIAPTVVEQAKDFGTNIPAYATSFREHTRDLNRRFDRLRIPDEVQAEMNRKITDIGSDITSTVGNFLLLMVTYLPWLLLVPVLAFFFLKDANQFRLLVLRLFPVGRWRYRAELVMSDLNTTLAAYTRAELLSCVVIAMECTVGFYVIGLKYALLLGILAGIFEFVPLLGPFTIGVLITITAASSDNPRNAIYVVIFLVVIRVIHDYVTYPRIVRDGIHMHPLAIILSVLAGEQIAGIPGVFLSIPIVAVCSVVYRHVLEHQGRRGLLSGLIHDVEVATEEVV